MKGESILSLSLRKYAEDLTVDELEQVIYALQIILFEKKKEKNEITITKHIDNDSQKTFYQLEWEFGWFNVTPSNIISMRQLLRSAGYVITDSVSH